MGWASLEAKISWDFTSTLLYGLDSRVCVCVRADGLLRMTRWFEIVNLQPSICNL